LLTRLYCFLPFPLFHLHLAFSSGPLLHCWLAWNTFIQMSPLLVLDHILNKACPEFVPPASSHPLRLPTPLHLLCFFFIFCFSLALSITPHNYLYIICSLLSILYTTRQASWEQGTLFGSLMNQPQGPAQSPGTQ
jgi:hypothetical protein